MATPASIMKRPVGRPRKIPRTQEEEEEFKRRQMKAMAMRSARAQMKEEYMDDDDEDFDDEDLDDEDYDTDEGAYFDLRSSARRNIGRPRIPKPLKSMEQEMQNKSLMCKPLMVTKATSCNPIRVGKITQTEFGDPDEKKVFVPVEFPMFVPTPLAFNAPSVPCFVPVPLTISVPNVTPIHKNAIGKALKELEDIYESLPEEENHVTFKEQERLIDILQRLNAEINEVEVIVNIGKEEIMESNESNIVQPDSDINDDNGVLANNENGAMEVGELENMNKLNGLQPDKTDKTDMMEQGEYSQLSQEVDDSVQLSSEQLDLMQNVKKQSLVITQRQAIIPQAPFRQVPLDDSNMKLKYAYGVKAYKYWAIKKNAELKAAWKELCQKDGVIPPFKPVKNELLACSMSELSFYLGSFVSEIIKPNDEPYFPDTIFYFCLGIQYYLSENGRSDDIFHDETFEHFYEALHSKLLDSQLRINIQGLTFCHVTEEHLWESKYLGALNPYTILETMVYMNTKSYLLFDLESHLALSFSNVMKQWKKNGVTSDGKPPRTVFLKYNPTTTMQAAIEKKHRIDPNITYEQLENVENPLRCPVKLYEFYMSKCPDAVKHRNDVYYLQPEPCCMPSSPVWFSSNQLDQDIMSMMISRAKVVREVQENFQTQRNLIPSSNPTHHVNGPAFYMA